MLGGRRQFILILAIIAGLLSVLQLTFAAPFQPGQIFFAYDGSNIGVFADTVWLKGDQIGTIQLFPSTFTTGATLTGGGGIALDELGDLYVTVQNFEGRANRRGIIKINRDGRIAWKADSGGTLDYRGIVASATLNRVYVATAGGTGQAGIHVYRADNGAKLTIEYFGGTLANRDLAFDKQGNLYALRHNAVVRWLAGSFSGTGTTVFSIPTEDPRAIVIDENSNIYITFEDTKVVRKYSPTGTLLATYLTPINTGSLIGLDYDPGAQRLFASHMGTKIGQILWINRNAPDRTEMNAFGPTGLSGVRWLAVYPTPEPTTAMLIAVGLLLLKRRFRRR